jgi:serine/threonine-protein kinase
MSPEQATGEEVVGPATDIYALACVLHEMLVGEPPYVGATAQAVLGKIISGGAVYAKEQRGSIPANVDAAIRKALEKLPADRFSSGQGFADALADPAFRHGERAAAASTWNRVTIGAAALAAFFGVAFGWAVTRSQPTEPTTRVSVRIPEGQDLWYQFDISADGSLMVYRGPGTSETGTSLWARRWDALEATRIPDTDIGGAPVISPDGREVAFTQERTIRIVPLQGGVSRSIGGDSLPTYNIRWGPAGEWIYFQGFGTSSLYRVPAEGGAVELVAQIDSVGTTVLWFDILPSGRGAVIELTFSGSPTLHALDLETGETRALTAGQFPRYANGHLFFGTPNGTTLMRAPFDPDRMELTGAALPVAEEVLFLASSGRNFFAVSQTGTLVYRAGAAPEVSSDIVWVDRTGVISPTDPDWTFNPGANNRGLSLSPDGSRVVVTTLEGNNYDIWIKELPQGALSRLTYHEAWDVRPRWTPDGRAVTFLSTRDAEGTNANILVKRAAGTEDPTLLMDHELPIWEAAYSPDMAWLLGRTGGTTTVAGGRDVWATQPGTDGLFPLLRTDFDEKAISLSPDGRFLLYESDETTRNEVYVRPFPNVNEDKVTVSTDGGVMPVWSRSGNEVFYVDAQDRMVAATVETDPDFRVLDRTVLFELPDNILFLQSEQYPLYDVAPGDDRFIMFRTHVSAELVAELILVRNWPGELER